MEVSKLPRTHPYDLPSAKEWIWKDTSAYELSFVKRVVLINHQVTGAYDPPTEKEGICLLTCALSGLSSEGCTHEGNLHDNRREVGY